TRTSLRARFRELCELSTASKSRRSRQEDDGHGMEKKRPTTSATSKSGGRDSNPRPRAWEASPGLLNVTTGSWQPSSPGETSGKGSQTLPAVRSECPRRGQSPRQDRGISLTLRRGGGDSSIFEPAGMHRAFY